MHALPEKYADLRNILSSVHYLEGEAQRAGYAEIGLIFRKTISDINCWMETHKVDPAICYPEVIRSDLYKILKIQDKLALVQRLDVNGVLAAIEAYEKKAA